MVASNEIENSDHKLITKRDKYLETLLHHFLGRWKKEYLPALREHHKRNKNSSNRIVSRQRWPLVIITELIPGKEGGHAATAKTLDNAKKTIYIYIYI